MTVRFAHYGADMFAAKRTMSAVLLAFFLAPSPGAWSRGLLRHRRRAHCPAARTFQVAAPNPTETAKATSDDTQETLAEVAQTPASSSADLFDYDAHTLKRSRRKHSTDTTVTPAYERVKIETVSVLLPVLRVQVTICPPRLREAAEPLPRFGSGPCHSIPRPREGTIELPFQSAALLA